MKIKEIYVIKDCISGFYYCETLKKFTPKLEEEATHYTEKSNAYNVLHSEPTIPVGMYQIIGPIITKNDGKRI